MKNLGRFLHRQIVKGSNFITSVKKKEEVGGNVPVLQNIGYLVWAVSYNISDVPEEPPVTVSIS